MTRKTFYRKLKQVKNQFDWKLEQNCIRSNQDNLSFCPITAVNYALNRKYFTEVNVNDAAKQLGLSELDWEYIAGCADNRIKIRINDKVIPCRSYEYLKNLLEIK
jgi:hypothetical protein